MSGLQSPSPRTHPIRGDAGGRWRAARRIGALAGCLAAAALGSTASVAGAATTPMVDLGTASTYAVISGASVGNTVSAPGAPPTTLRGDLGVKANAQPLGFPPGIVTGTQHIGDAAAIAAHDDLVAAYDEVEDRTNGAPLALALDGKTIGPGLHKIDGAASTAAGATVTLDAGGIPDAVFVFQVNGAMTLAANTKIVLAGGAQASRVFWQVNGAGAVGAGSSFVGTVMALNAIAVGNGTTVNGRAFARNGALTLDANEFYSSPPVVTVDGGANATTTDTTPTISGTTDVTGTDAVTVMVDDTPLKATPVDGKWSVTSGLLANGTYSVVASVKDGADNRSSADQQLTVDTVLPVVTLAGGDVVLTDDASPTISGTTDVAVDSIVDVVVAGQSLSAVVHTGGTWNVSPATLADGTYEVSASVTDPAGNVGTATQELTVDTTPPALTITGGAADLTNDATPVIAGTADVPAGRAVTVELSDQDLQAVVGEDGAWSVTAPAQSEGPHRVTADVSDAAGNRSSATQSLTVDTVAPVVTITGGSTATTADATPTIRGTSDATVGTTVTVTIDHQTVTALVQADGSWNATPTLVGAGTWSVVATVPDPATNVGRAEQQLTITGDAVLPVVALTGGDAVLTNDATPTISGTTNAAVSSTVDVTVDGQELEAVVDADHTWNVAAAALADGTHEVSASVTDDGGNVGTDTQVLTVDTTAPGLTITGGGTRLTNDGTPTISGSATGVPIDTRVTVELAEGTQIAKTQANGSWSITAPGLSEGPHGVVVDVSDAAGNPSSATQMLTVDTVVPVVTITGGPAATTADTTPTIRGTSDATAGTSVTVTIDHQTITALVQSDGSWNATPTAVGPGTWSVVAAVSDPAENVGRAEQQLTVSGTTGGGGDTGGGDTGGGDTGGGGGSTDAGTSGGSTGDAAGSGSTGGAGTTVVPGGAVTVPPAVTTPPAAVPVTVSAGAVVARSGSLRLRGTSLSIGTKVSAPAGGRIAVSVRGTLRITGVAKAIRLSSASAKLAAGRSTTLRIRPSGGTKAAATAFRRIRAATRKGTKVTATLTVTIVDAAGHTRRVTRTVRLTK
jgi:hypothetical protein